MHIILIEFNCISESPMCFVRSWRARSRHAWIVQRGCYLSSKVDPLPKAMSEPTRSMTCMRRRYIVCIQLLYYKVHMNCFSEISFFRLVDAEYKVCLCQSDWCNSTPTNFKPKELYLLYWTLGTLAYIFNLSNCIF